MGEKKRVRMLLRVSSNQQLEEDGDLGIQRQLVKEFIAQHEEWHLDSKEYFEGSNSGYSNAVENRDILQQALRDAQRNDPHKSKISPIRFIANRASNSVAKNGE